MRSRLPVPCLLGLFGALLVLFPEVVMWMSEGFTQTPFTDPGVQKALAAAVEQYNRDSTSSPYYVKLLCAQEAWVKDTKDVYHFKVETVQTICKKKAGEIMNYKEIQKCDQLPGNPKKQTCFITVAVTSRNKMFYSGSGCFVTKPPKDPCSVFEF